MLVHGRRQAHVQRAWLLAILIATLLIVAVVPLSDLRSVNDWSNAGERIVRGIPTLLLYLAGVLTLTVVVGVPGRWLIQHDGRFGRALRSIMYPFAQAGLSPLQPAGAGILFFIVIVTSIGHLSLFGVSLRSLSFTWEIGIFVTILFGLTLGAELALQLSDGEGGIRVLATVFQEQAPALGGRLAAQVFTSVLLTVALTREMGTRAHLPHPADGVVVALVAAALAWFIWSIARLLKRAERDDMLEIDNHAGSLSSPVRRGLAWLLLVIAIIGPISLAAKTPNPLRQSFTNRLHAPSHLAPLSANWGTDAFGRDQRAILLRAWRSDVELGALAGIAALALGLLWRGASHWITRPARSTVEAVAVFIPPVVLFYAVWGAVGAFRPQAFDLTTVVIAVAIVLVPQALALARYPIGQLPVIAGVLVLLGTLLMLGWQLVIGPSFIQPLSPSIGVALGNAQSSYQQAPWLFWSTLEVIGAIIVLNVVALTALVSTHGLPRSLTCLRG